LYKRPSLSQRKGSRHVRTLSKEGFVDDGRGMLGEEEGRYQQLGPQLFGGWSSSITNEGPPLLGK